uniref:Ig-like domain-containing protein n=1 Tax=Glossina austeni TaxID=7395 RepID=A0A1A9VY71_GLOAU
MAPCTTKLRKENISCLQQSSVREDFVKKVSWIRKRDLHILTAGSTTYTSDQRFQVIRPENSGNWTLQIKYPQPRDSGIYECQINTEPKMSLSYTFNVIDLLRGNYSPFTNLKMNLSGRRFAPYKGLKCEGAVCFEQIVLLGSCKKVIKFLDSIEGAKKAACNYQNLYLVYWLPPRQNTPKLDGEDRDESKAFFGLDILPVQHIASQTNSKHMVVTYALLKG